ncbi:MAG TPA: hypothetical protein K8U78_01365 [Aeriscardovia aeriphila]|uniref:Uncharacterized protein n=1 Tax=Aeriscardovia aeriphila TaxID=218139 RepID=A0A921KAX5_9BIFI|nr:hypothetical protein [Aeriscardovia aeriphila]
MVFIRRGAHARRVRHTRNNKWQEEAVTRPALSTIPLRGNDYASGRLITWSIADVRQMRLSA